jgi:hypothetical protein
MMELVIEANDEAHSRTKVQAQPWSFPRQRPFPAFIDIREGAKPGISRS